MTTRPKITEAQFQNMVVQMAALLGWRSYHTTLSIRSQPGFPDLALFHPEHGALYLELKTGTYGLTGPQQDWLDWLQRCGQAAYVVRPGDMDMIETILRGGSHHG